MSTQICGPTINAGDPVATLKSACGEPAFINEGVKKDTSENTKEITELTYQGSPIVVLEFENGKLTARK